MSETTQNSDAAAFVAHWARVGPLLAHATRQEQRRLTEEQHLHAVANVLELARPDSTQSKTSGLVEQQCLFMKGRK